MTGPLAVLARTCLMLVIVLASLSAYLRLDHSGIGCEPWPTCYGQIDAPAAESGIVSTYERLLDDARAPLSWATPLHRLVASLLGVLVLVMNMFAWYERRQRLVSLGVLALTVFLAWLGIYSEGLHSPAVVMGNLCGGFVMLGLLGVMVFRSSGRNADSRLRYVTVLAIITLGAQIFFGGLTSANFAASACQTFPDCHGTWLPGLELATAFDLTRTHELASSGRVIGGAERAAIHKLHRLGAILTLVTVFAAGFTAIRAGGDLRISGTIVSALVCAEAALGVAAILGSLPIGVAVAHNLLAALLLLALTHLHGQASGAQRHA